MSLDVRPAPVAGRLQSRILVASTRLDLRVALAAILTEAAFSVSMAVSDTELVERVHQTVPDVLLVDHPVVDCPLLGVARKATSAPIVAVVPADSPALALAALHEGANDCISIRDHFAEDHNASAELVWRLRGVILKSQRGQDPAATLEGPYEILMRPFAHELTVHGLPVDLTPREFAVLRLLLERRGEVVAPDEMAEVEWGYEAPRAPNFVQAHVSRVRAKLRAAGAPDVIITVRGVGYKIR